MIRVLFVDDEVRVLDGLRRMLRPQRHEWEMEFVVSGQEALAAMGDNPADVVVSDMKMPGMDGVQLLSEVKRRHPESIRIVLSGQAERHAIVNVVDQTHQYLAKPCEPDVLKATIDRAHALRMVLRNDDLQRLVSQMDSLPSIPSLFEDVLEELSKPGPSLKRVGEIIESDIGMSATILKLVNSAFFGLKRSVSSVTSALQFLGLETINALVLGHGIFEQFDESKIPGFSLDALWSHSLRTSRFAMAIATFEGLEKDVANQTFTAGMLHDTGKLVLASNVPEAYGRVIGALEECGGPTAPIEREILRATHGEVGAYLLGLWGLPDGVVEAVAFHTSPGDCIAPSLGALAIVHVADVLAHDQGSAEIPAEDLPLDHEYLRNLGLEQRWLEWRAACMATEEES